MRPRRKASSTRRPISRLWSGRTSRRAAALACLLRAPHLPLISTVIQMANINKHNGKTLHAEIAGGGFGGLTAATALAQRGWSVRLHEKGPELRAFGAGIY